MVLEPLRNGWGPGKAYNVSNFFQLVFEAYLFIYLLVKLSDMHRLSVCPVTEETLYWKSVLDTDIFVKFISYYLYDGSNVSLSLSFWI